ncbi:MAG: hypothetical protein ACE5GJ_06755 [Gemmatimonadota bacterium]
MIQDLRAILVRYGAFALQTAVVIFLAVGSAACRGEGEAPGGTAEAVPAGDTLIRPMERVPLTERDMAGLSMDNLAMELPWTENRVSREPLPASARGILESVDLSTTDDFDRAIFTFSRAAPVPGYELDIVEPGAEVACGEETKKVDLDGEEVLVLRFRPATLTLPSGSRLLKPGTRRISLPHYREEGILCEARDEVVWAAGIASQKEVRILEMRNPQRVVVDIR